jgi:HEAT repeats
MSRLTLCGLLLLSMAVMPATAQDVVTLKSGEKLAGEVTDGMLGLRLTSPAGEVSLPWSRIEKIDRAAYVRELYRDRAGQIDAASAKDHFLLALWCRRQGLAKEMSAELARVIELDPENPGARAALGFAKVDEKWVAGDQILTAKGLVRRGDQWVLKEELAFDQMIRESRKPLSEGELKAADLIARAAGFNERARKFATTALASMSFEELRIPLYRALADRDPKVRAVAACELGKLQQVEAVRPLIRTAVLDTSPEVRGEAVLAVRGLGEPGSVVPFIRALASTRPQVRMNAAEALGNLGDIRGVEYLVSRLGQNWGPTQRNNIEIMHQISYIRDFDVEIAQASQIGDPIVGLLREGVILDVRVIGASRKMQVVERRFIRSALVKLTGEDLGDDATAWSDWWGKNKDRLLAQAGE